MQNSHPNGWLFSCIRSIQVSRYIPPISFQIFFFFQRPLTRWGRNSTISLVPLAWFSNHRLPSSFLCLLVPNLIGVYQFIPLPIFVNYSRISCGSSSKFLCLLAPHLMRHLACLCSLLPNIIRVLFYKKVLFLKIPFLYTLLVPSL